MSVQYTQPSTVPSSGDPIAQLPVDQTPPTNTEVQIIDTLFKKHRGTMDVIVEESKDALLVAVLIILLSVPPVNGLMNKLLPITTTSPYVAILIKGLLGAVIFWLVKHFYLSRKS